MSERHWFQVHLSTAVALMLVAGGFVWVNTQEATRQWRRHSSLTVTGWPFSITEMFHLDAQKERADGIDFELSDSDKIERGTDGEVAKIERAAFNLTGLLFDIGIAVIILVAIAFFSEYILRRREARKT